VRMMTMPSGLTLHCVDTRGNGPPRPPALCVHGMFAGAWHFDGWLSPLADRGYGARTTFVTYSWERTVIVHACHCLLLGIVLLLQLAGGPAYGSDLVDFQATALKGPECIADASLSFFSQNVQPAEPPHPSLPIGRYYMIVRYLGPDSISAPATADFGHFPQSYPWPPLRDAALTGLSLPDPKNAWQRASHAGATLDDSSAFQLHCYDGGSFINTWTFADDSSITGGGPHSIYGYSFDNANTPLIYDSNPATDFVLQASVEIPWFAAWSDPLRPPGAGPVGQVNLFAYFRDRLSNKTFALLLAIFDNRFATNQTYVPFVAHDGATPFVSTPIAANAKYATVSPVSSDFTGTAWTGLRFFRVHVTQDNFRQALADINSYCEAHTALRFCGISTSTGNAYSPSVIDYQITDFGVIHEIGRNPNDNLSMGVHIFDLGAWNFR
jgi:hypothetical protein